MKNNFLYILMVITLFTCYDSHGQANKQNSNWKGKKITLPAAVLMRNDSQKNINPLSKKIKIFTVINGGCPLCVDALKEWETYMKTVDTAQVGFVFLVHSEDDLFTFKELNREYIKLPYPYFHDVRKKIMIANKLTDENAHHTFLLDSSNTVILTGNPTKSKETFKIYSDEINKRVPKNKPTVQVSQGVKGPVIRMSKGFVYKDQNGTILQQSTGEKMMSDKKFIPNIDTEHGVITFKQQ